MDSSPISKGFFNPISITLLIILAAAGAGLYSLQIIGVPVFVTWLIVAIFISSSIYIADQWARVILGTAETEIAEKFAKASEQYRDNPVALHLRGMNMLFEGLKEKGSMVIVPSSALDSMNVGAMGGLNSLAKTSET